VARIVVHADALDGIDTEPLMRKLANDVADDARQLAPQRTGRLRLSISVVEVTDRRAVVAATAKHPEPSKSGSYAFYVEKGTSDTKARPFLRPALYKYRTP
jgi:HK97 gp10 family phage protein